jgi:5'-nucleotidase
MKILLSNDDGVTAEGLKVLAEALSHIGEVKVVAPDRNRSGASNSLTLTHPLRCRTLENGFISVEGTPTDCVHLALTGMLENWKPDIVVSGINEGANLGDDILYSGTVAAAVEGRHLGLSAVAVSLCTAYPVATTTHYATAAALTKQIVLKLKADPLPTQTILNVNVPNIPLGDLKGFEITRLGTRHLAEPTIKQVDPRGRTVYWVGPPGAAEDAGLETDFYAINRNYASITPLKIDFTNYHVMEHLNNWVANDGLSL